MEYELKNHVVWQVLSMCGVDACKETFLNNVFDD